MQQTDDVVYVPGLTDLFGRHTYHGKFDRPFTHYLWDKMLNGDEGDEWETDAYGSGDWINRYGKRVLFGDNRGFVYSHRFDTEDDAKAEVELFRRQHNEDDDYTQSYEPQACAGFGGE